MSTNKNISLDWYEPRDYFGAGRDFWLQSQCLLGVLSGASLSEVNPDTVSLALAYADGLLQRSTSASLTAVEWAAGHIMYGILSGMTSYTPGTEWVVGSLALELAHAILDKNGYSLTCPVLRMVGSHYRDGYLLSAPMRWSVRLLGDMLRDTHDLTEPRALATKAIARARSVSWVEGRDDLTRAILPWLVRLGPTEEAVRWVVACGGALVKGRLAGDWAAQQMMVAVISGLASIGNHAPDSVAQSAAALSKALSLAISVQGDSLTDPAYRWLSTMVLAELARASQAEWSPEEMAEAAEAAVRVTTEFLQVVNAWPVA